MSCPLPPDLWERLCTHLATHATCSVTIHQHEWQVICLDLGTMKQRVKAGAAPTARRVHGDVSVFWGGAEHKT